MSEVEPEIKSEMFVFTDAVAQKEEYLAWARNKVLRLKSQEYYDWMMKERGSYVLGSTAWFINKYGKNGEVFFDSAISIDWFTVEGEDYSDLTPYVIEHEVQESYAKICIKKGVMQPQDTHRIGMMAEFKRAKEDGKHHRLAEFMMKTSSVRAHEFQEAYDLVKD